MRSTAFASIAAVTSGSLVVACAASPASRPPDRFIPCPAIALAGDPLVYPIPGATGVSTSIGTLLLQSRTPPSLQGSPTFDLLRDDGTVVARATLSVAPSPLPSPIATPFDGTSSPPDPGAFVVPKLPSTSRLTVQQEPQPAGCPVPVGASGSFTTGA